MNHTWWRPYFLEIFEPIWIKRRRAEHGLFIRTLESWLINNCQNLTVMPFQINSSKCYLSGLNPHRGAAAVAAEGSCCSDLFRCYMSADFLNDCRSVPHVWCCLCSLDGDFRSLSSGLPPLRGARGCRTPNPDGEQVRQMTFLAPPSSRLMCHFCQFLTHMARWIYHWMGALLKVWMRMFVFH